MVHLRSRQKRIDRKKAREEKQKRQATERWILLNFSQRDYLNGEICHTVFTEPIVYEKIKVVLGDGFSPICANLEYGQVLNRYSEILRTIVSVGRYKH